MSKQNKLFSVRLFLLVLFLGGFGSALAAGFGGQPAASRHFLMSLNQVDRREMPAVDIRETAREDASRAESGEPYRFALPRQVDLTPDNSGTWEMLSDTGRVWRLRLSCPGALSLNLGFEEFELSSGVQLRVYAGDGSGSVLAFGERDNRSHGQLWTPVLLTDEVVVELELPPGAQAYWRLQLGTIGCGYRYFGEDPAEKSGTCNVDVVCSEGNDWRPEIATVGVYSFGGAKLCTGAMINNTNQDEQPLFLTANHCGVTTILAPSVVVYWNFQSPTCGQQGGGSLAQFNTGSALLANSSVTDFTLLELEENPNPDFGVKFAGWDRTGVSPSSAVCIHHPNTDEKSISFENNPLTVTTYLNPASPGNGTHLRVADWDLGTTEPGSSGAPLFSPQKLIIGQLHGGYASCTLNDESDWFGRLSESWSGGGTPDSRLSTWLDPGNLGVQTLALLDPDIGPEDPPASNANIRITQAAPNPFRGYVQFTVEMDRAAAITAKVYNLGGKLVADLGESILGEGENLFPWGGFAGDGSRLPAGAYVLVMESEGKTAKQTFMRLN